ncbi:MAG: acyl-ACP--UDP-N-acetylglucosamine O-acyltransferase [Gammaproteobacteria bacterium]|nr:acyl-ACP--UDP-N-acetylglucosamine O-acyltransferase [Gammaproteobacteria bacterium]
MPQIHPSAIIEDGADVDPSASIGPFSIVETGAIVGPCCEIQSNVRIYRHTRMGRDNVVCHGATIGSAPQDLGFAPDKAKPLTIGDGNHFKECVNISHGVKEEHGTVIGNGNYLMAFSHIGHDCVVGDHNVFANTATLGGHVEMGGHAFLSGHVAVHQFCRVGDYVMIGGVSGVRQDVPPYAMANGQLARFVGLNLVGLRRAGFSQVQRSAIKQAYRVLLQSGLRLPDALAQIAATADTDEVRNIVAFVERSQRGIVSAD